MDTLIMYLAIPYQFVGQNEWFALAFYFCLFATARWLVIYTADAPKRRRECALSEIRYLNESKRIEHENAEFEHEKARRLHERRIWQNKVSTVKQYPREETQKPREVANRR
jgi:hypothetical protein